MKNNSVLNNTIKYDYCSGCGICSVVCPKKAISIVYSNIKTYIPIVEEKLCSNCGKCSDICPNETHRKNKELKILKESSDPISIGIDNSIMSYRCITRNTDELLKSASGGFVTTFAKKMLSSGKIDCVLHAERILAYTGEEHFKSCISYSTDELDKRRSSIYGPVTFNKSLEELYNKKLNVLAIGVPCVISGLKNLFSKNPHFKNNRLITIALVCSHNVSGGFIDFFAEKYGIDKEQKYTVNLRGKNLDMKDHTSYRLHFYNKENKLLIDKDRKYFNPVWRNYFFAMDSCNYCNDLWGRNADISCKDCWGSEGENDKYGSSLVIFRNNELLKTFYNMKEFEIYEIPFERVRISEYPSAIYKQKDIVKRIELKQENIFIKNSKISKTVYLEQGCEKLFEMVSDYIVSEKKNLKKIIKTNIKKFTDLFHITKFIRFLFHIIKKIYNFFKGLFVYEKKQYNKIIMLGGFDGGNAGDEAQIDSTIKIIMDRYPGYIIKVLSHVPYITWKNHYRCVVGPNPRISLWDLDISPDLYCSNLANPINRVRFLIRGYWACFNSHLMKKHLPLFFLNAKRAAFLEDIRTSDLLYISGGGTMTGDTLSRCWDNVFCMKIAKIFKVPYVMSGQNAGNWDSSFTKRFVSKVLRNSEAVTLRDSFAVDNLKQIGVNKESVFTAFDDALFCDKENNVSDYLDRFNVKNNYIVLNIHYWGVTNNEEKQLILQKVSEFCDYMYSKTGLDILCIPMSNTDEEPIEDFLGFYNKEYIKVARFSFYDFRIIRGLISKSEYCITMKHHPIIFAIGEGIPTISIAYKPYYTYKNLGALKIFGLEKYGIDIEKDNYLSNFKILFDDITMNFKDIKTKINNSLKEIKPRREKFFRIIDKILIKD